MKSSFNRILRPGVDIKVEDFQPAKDSDALPEVRDLLVQDGFQDISVKKEDPKENGQAPAEDPASPLLEKARQEAKEFVEKARQEAESIREAAKKEGYDEGYREGLSQGEADGKKQYDSRAMELLSEVKKTVDDIQDIKRGIVEKYLGELLDVSLSVAEKVIHVSLRTSGDIIRRMISQEVDQKKKTEWIRIYIDRQDYEMVTSADADVAQELTRLTDDIKFIVLDGEPEGHLIMETPEEVADLSVDTQMKNIRERLSGVPLDAGKVLKTDS